MNIAIIVRRLDGKGGTQRQALILARELISRGHGVKLYTLRFNKERCYPELSSNLDIASLERVLSGFPRRWAAFLGRFSGFLQETYLAKRLSLLIDRGTEILNPHDSVAYRAAYFVKKRETSHQNKFGTGQAKNKKYVPSVWAMNDVPAFAWTYDRIGAFEPVWHSPLRRFIMRVLDWYDRRRFIAGQDIIAVLDHFNEGLVRKYLGRESVITRLGIDAGQFSFVPHAPPASRRVRLLAIGIFFPHRRFEDAIEAIVILRSRGYDAALTIIGSPKPAPSYAERLRKLVAERGIASYVDFAGEVSETDLIRAYREHDVFVFTNYLQTWGHVPLEAMATGIPAIVSRGAGVHEVLSDGETALLVNPKSPGQIADAAERLLKDPALYRKLVERGRKFVEERITWGGYTEAILDLFRRALTRSAA
ncbi:MAG: glycosyltransferase family 4 protein [bacterium]|nr:glycosyltransferase family 4 protein [bacterium]